MKIFNYRKLPEDFNQDIFIWDVDKTYLNTEFESWKGLVKTLLEFSIDKRSIPGAKELLCEIRRGKGKKIALCPIYFISATPLQLKKVLEGKLLLDGIQHDGIILKDYRWMKKNCESLRLKNNFSYKLISLLSHRLQMPPMSHEYLFGDDYEHDAEVYSLYADILDQKINEATLKNILLKQKLTLKEQDVILKLLGQVGLQPSNPVIQQQVNSVILKAESPKDLPIVQNIFIYMFKNKDPKRLKNYGSRLISTYNYAQTAAILYDRQKISKVSVERVFHQYSKSRSSADWDIKPSIEDLKQRELISQEAYREISSM